MFKCLRVTVAVCLHTLCASFRLSVCLPTCLSVNTSPSVHLFVYLSVYLSVNLFLDMFVDLFFYICSVFSCPITFTIGWFTTLRHVAIQSGYRKYHLNSSCH